MSGTDRLRAIRAQLGGRGIVWFGTRGIDAAPVFALARPASVVSQVAALPPSAAEGVAQDCLEERSCLRVDLDRYDIDLDQSAKARGLKTQLVSRAHGRLVVVAYRPAEFLTAIAFCNDELITAFNFHLMQRQFEHKPWVDRLLRRFDPSLPMLPTRFVRDTDAEQVRRLLAEGPLVGKTTMSSGGAGVFLIENEGDFTEHVPSHRDGFISVTPFLSGARPLNVNACVYASGAVAVFGVSYQLIGIPNLSTRRFGFCGNDFAAAADLPAEDLRSVEELTRRAGACLARTGYRGIFGLDLLRHDRGLAIVEVNARFQGSTALSSCLNQALGMPDPTTEHIASFLDLDAPTMPSCAEQTRAVRGLNGAVPVAQAFHRNLMLDNLYLDAAPERPGVAIDAAASPRTSVERGAILFRSLHHAAITADGYTVGPVVPTLTAAAKVAF